MLGTSRLLYRPALTALLTISLISRERSVSLDFDFDFGTSLDPNFHKPVFLMFFY